MIDSHDLFKIKLNRNKKFTLLVCLSYICTQEPRNRRSKELIKYLDNMIDVMLQPSTLIITKKMIGIVSIAELEHIGPSYDVIEQ